MIATVASVTDILPAFHGFGAVRLYSGEDASWEAKTSPEPKKNHPENDRCSYSMIKVLLTGAASTDHLGTSWLFRKRNLRGILGAKFCLKESIYF